MKTKLGILMMVAGVLLVFGACKLFLENQKEQQLARESVNQLMPQVAEAILERHEQKVEKVLLQETAKATEPEAPQNLAAVVTVTEPRKTKMPEVDIDGHGYIGFIRFHSAGVELPIMADWSYPQLKIAPCRFSGDMYTDDLVIMAHNYDYHFGIIHGLRVGERITVTDMDGQMVEYEVVAMDILPPTAVEEMTAGEYDLTLFTCTYGGENRVTARCDRVK